MMRTPEQKQERRVELRARWTSLTPAERAEYLTLTRELAAQDLQVIKGVLTPGSDARRVARYARKRQN